jgi:CBS domain-containing protein
MKVSGSIANILQLKGRNVWFISPDATVLEAIQLLADRNVGALLVMADDKLVGIFSERDYTRKVALKNRSSKETKVGEITSPLVVSVTEAQSLDDAMRLMTEHRVRHLPVLESGRVVGMVSIGDLVNWTISAQGVALEQMQNYLTGGYPQPAA